MWQFLEWGGVLYLTPPPFCFNTPYSFCVSHATFDRQIIISISCFIFCHDVEPSNSKSQTLRNMLEAAKLLCFYDME